MNRNGTNGTNSKRAQNVDWVRERLHKCIDERIERGQIMNRELLMAFKWLLTIEGVKLSGVGPPKKARKGKNKPQPLKMPALLEKFDGVVV